METSSSPQHIYPFLQGGGEMGELTRTYDWAQTSLGPPSSWPQSLCTTLGIVLHSAFPMFLFWGNELTCFYNDAFRPSLGSAGKHPALGKTGKEVWPEIWDFIGPLIQQVMTTGEPVYFDDQLVPFYRNSRVEDIYWTFSYSPAYGDDGHINGVFVTCTETTEKIRTIKQLRESNDQLAFAIEATELGTWDLNPITNTVSANARLKQWLGQPLDGDISLPVAIAVIADKDRERVIEAIQKALQYDSGGTFDIDFTLVHPVSLDERIVRAKGKAWFTDEQIAYRFNGTLQDITERKQAEKILTDSEQTLRSIVESAPFPIGVYIGPHMQIQLVNQSIMNVWGKGNEVVGKRYADVLPELKDQGIYEQLDNVYRTGVAFHARQQRVDLEVDGKIQPFFFNYSFTPLFNADGQVYGVMNTAAEITDLILAKQKIEDTEAALRGAVELAELANWSMDVQTRRFQYSERFMDWLGFTENTKSLDEAYNPLPDEFKQQVADAIEAVLQPGSSGYYKNEHPIINRLTGQVRIIHAQAQLFYDTNGNPVRLSGTAQDITQQRQLQIALERQVQERTEELEASNEELAAINEELAATNEEIAVANKDLEESNKNLLRSNQNLEQFAYVASHDLQEPLRKIQQFGDLLKTRYTASTGDELIYLERMQSAASRMSVLIKDLLTFARISTQQDATQPVSLNQVINSVLNDLELAIQDTNAVVRVGALPTIMGDRGQLGQLFLNLFSNALKFHQPDLPPLIRVEASQVSVNKLPASINPARGTKIYHRIDVVDNGIGFDEKYVNRIFQVFQRLHSKNKFAGTGIGLAICEKVAVNHGGAITAHSKPGQGATFSVFLPV
ncbi:PAS domain-containing protein [Spirosoma sp. KNUC1025]|uniref:PAS domain-containing protein n=1 Tax=Spirosoma sp. KNUC1025 TaxID=2894082 RepID=UPI00386C6808|nr:PAS domain-containing protein [Spirosoma sp. KNUC1025]